MFTKKVATYTMVPDFPAMVIVSDNNALAEGETVIAILYNCVLETVLINNVWELGLGISATRECFLPPEMGGDGHKSITFKIDASKLPSETLEGSILITKKTEEICLFKYLWNKIFKR